MTVPASNTLGLSRGEIPERTREVLSRGGWGNPDVLLVESATGPVVVKDFAPRRWLVRRWLGPWLLRREARAYRRLAGIPAVPLLLGWLDASAIVLEFRPGVYLSRGLAGRLPPEFVAHLEDAVREIHGRGVVHLDLRHRSNVLADRDGRPVVIDFASALFFDVSTLAGRSALAVFAEVDRRALRKWRIRLN